MIKGTLNEVLSDVKIRNTWQYQTLKSISSEYNTSVIKIIQKAASERGFWGYLGKSTQKYICGDSTLRKQIEEERTKIVSKGFGTKILDPETIVAAGGASLGTYLVTVYPALSVFGAPAIAGIVIVLYRIGLDAFCSYMEDYFKGLGADKENTF